MMHLKANRIWGWCGVLLGLAAAPAMAQFGEPFTPPEVSAPVLEVWVFEEPLVPVVVLVVIGMIAGFMLSRAGRNKQAGLVFSGLALIAVGLIVSSSIVITQREHVAKVSREFIDAVAENETSKARYLMRPTVSLRMGFGARAETRDSLLAQINRLHNEADVRSAKVLDARCEIRSGTLARAIVRVKIEGDAGGVPIPPYSWWKLDIARENQPGAPWRVAAIEPLWMTGISNPAGR